MNFTWSFHYQFAAEFDRYPRDQQDKILDFLETYQEHGLADFSKFPGKVTPSWSGLYEFDPRYRYTRDNALWHYHIGLPQYTQKHKYQTSDWVLHFQWKNRGNHIDVADVCYHYTSNGSFHLPAPETLISIDPLSVATPASAESS